MSRFFGIIKFKLWSRNVEIFSVIVPLFQITSLEGDKIAPVLMPDIGKK